MTEPDDPNTLPKRTMQNTVCDGVAKRRAVRAQSATIISAMRFVAPITPTGRTALSVETSTKRSTPRQGGSLRKGCGANDIVENPGQHVSLDKRDMLVSRSM